MAKDDVGKSDLPSIGFMASEAHQAMLPIKKLSAAPDSAPKFDTGKHDDYSWLKPAISTGQMEPRIPTGSHHMRAGWVLLLRNISGR